MCLEEEEGGAGRRKREKKVPGKEEQGVMETVKGAESISMWRGRKEKSEKVSEKIAQNYIGSE